MHSQEEFMRSFTEWEIVGLNVAKKLQRMNGNQQLLPGTLINKVLMIGLYSELTRSTNS